MERRRREKGEEGVGESRSVGIIRQIIERQGE